jgi:hypothetical protein
LLRQWLRRRGYDARVSIHVCTQRGERCSGDVDHGQGRGSLGKGEEERKQIPRHVAGPRSRRTHPSIPAQVGRARQQDRTCRAAGQIRAGALTKDESGSGSGHALVFPSALHGIVVVVVILLLLQTSLGCRRLASASSSAASGLLAEEDGGHIPVQVWVPFPSRTFCREGKRRSPHRRGCVKCWVS